MLRRKQEGLDIPLSDTLEGSAVPPQLAELAEDVTRAPMRDQHLAAEMVPAKGSHRAGDHHVQARARLPDVEEMLAVAEGPWLPEAPQPGNVLLPQRCVNERAPGLQLRVREVGHSFEEVRLRGRHRGCS